MSNDAWKDLIARYEVRLLAFAESRLGRRAASEDVVQETFIEFLNSLPNYDFKRSLEAYLFAICAHKLTDHLRREGRRPTGAHLRIPPVDTMKTSRQIDTLLVERIRKGDTDAWCDLIARYEVRLLAFAESRLGRRAPSEDVVQETFIGFLHSLPNYDFKRSLEAFLFAICTYKLTDHLRGEGRRPTVGPPEDSTG